MAEIKRFVAGGVGRCLHQITREWREYERTNTAVLSAYIQPAAARYLNKLDSRLKADGFAGNLFIMQSNCGVDSVGRPPHPDHHGRAAQPPGFWGAAELGRPHRRAQPVALDIGGTTAKCSLIEDGRVAHHDRPLDPMRDRRSAGYPIMVPVGRPGRDRQWWRLDRLGRRFRPLHVGPQSVGARCRAGGLWTRRSREATTIMTIWPHQLRLFLRWHGDCRHGGSGAVADGAGRWMEALDDEAARGIIRIANNNMVNALKLVSLNSRLRSARLHRSPSAAGGATHAVALEA